MKQTRKVIRLRDYDYSSPGWYFVTVCVDKRECLLGELNEGKMVLSKMGKFVGREIASLKDKYKGIGLDYYVVMPNHIHLIVIIEGRGGVSPPQIEHGNPKGRGIRAPTLGQIIGYFKYLTTKKINQLNETPGARFWQRNYYEHIVRGEQELQQIREYIQTNPLRWEVDRENPVNYKGFVPRKYTACQAL